MSRRLRPPKPPVTGHPYVDNALRGQWREYREWLEAKDIGRFVGLPRKAKKFSRKNLYRGALLYLKPEYQVAVYLRMIGARK